MTSQHPCIALIGFIASFSLASSLAWRRPRDGKPYRIDGWDIILACLLLILAAAGCQTTAPAGVRLGDGEQIENGCLVEAIHAYRELTAAGVPAAVLAIHYRQGGKVYGHAMVTFAWPDKWTHVERWAWDRANQSQPLVSRIDDAPGVAAELFAEPTEAHVMAP